MFVAGAVFPGIIKSFHNSLSVPWACARFASISPVFPFLTRPPLLNAFLRSTEMVWHPLVKGFIVMDLYVLFPHQFFLRISPRTPLSARGEGRYLQIKMYVVLRATAENVLSIPKLCFHATLGKSLSCSFPGRSAWTETLAKQLFFMCFWPFKWLIFLEVVILLSLQALLLYHKSNEKNNQRMRFSFYSMVK